MFTMMNLQWFSLYCCMIFVYTHYTGKVFTSFDGEYATRVDGNARTLSICTRESDGYVFAAGRRDFMSDPKLDYIYYVARSTKDIEHVKTYQWQLEFEEGYVLNDEKPGFVLELPSSLFLKYHSKKGYSLITPTEIFSLNKISDIPSVCFKPADNIKWTDNIYPFTASSDELPDAICGELADNTACKEIDHFHAEDNACFGIYDMNKKEFVSGGIKDVNLKFGWDDQLRYYSYTDESESCCGNGPEYSIWKEEGIYTISWICGGQTFGGTYDLYVEKQIKKKKKSSLECPLFH
eukprot:417485_1